MLPAHVASEGMTALHYAALFDDGALVDTLLAHGADPTLTVQASYTAHGRRSPGTRQHSARAALQCSIGSKSTQLRFLFLISSNP